jgi:hypothetical protein
LKLHRYFIGIGTFAIVTGLLYFIGYLFKIDLLIFHKYYNETAEGFTSESRSLLPFIIGLGAGYLTEKFYLYKKYEIANKN